MGNPVAEPRVYRFDEFTLDARTGELIRNGTKLALREQPLQLLLALLEQPGELVSREQLIARLWEQGTFVDFDRGLNKAVNHLREALGDFV
jgi:DNA-binding winged helix-turn-helix (wHTH) protein